jgi:TonB family protein
MTRVFQGLHRFGLWAVGRPSVIVAYRRRGRSFGVLPLVLTVFGCRPSVNPASSPGAAESEGMPPQDVPRCESILPRRPNVVAFDANTMLGPKLLQSVMPVLPPREKTNGFEGDIIVRCVVTQGGAVEDCCIARGADGLNASIIVAVRKWKYEPATLRGAPVAVDYPITVRIVR